jgi:hypothetical protein
MAGQGAYNLLDLAFGLVETSGHLQELLPSLSYSADLMPFGVLVVVYHATPAGGPRTRRCMIHRSHYFPKTFLT